MKAGLLLITIVLFALSTNAQVREWAKTEPNDITANSSNDYDDAYHSATDSSGNLYILEDYNDSLYINGIYRTQGNGSYLAKYNLQGTLLRYKLITSANNLYGFAV